MNVRAAQAGHDAPDSVNISIRGGPSSQSEQNVLHYLSKLGLTLSLTKSLLADLSYDRKVFSEVGYPR